ncbi:TPA: HD family hydrolase [Yersinia enterocolitica]|nr:HD family hydrolase [Yersinia enterocolitica]HDL7605321.1 HD family hydrolase [Yersinia enterocolitica]HDL7608966.1 HD family hydrolase [Yersinia enterocolitica]HDL7613081.1 HD family hydrolase [Yersinia enterocolitica]HDL7617223.1 HD family hydrolase [Yersinia enterocolitica]
MSYITTYSGLDFDYLKPLASSICIEDIAQALSHECRFAGHLPNFYSVAQHCWLMSQIVPEEFALEALLHDATEAYCRDIPSPLKRLLPDYKVIEHRIDMAIREKFGLPAEMSSVVHYCDLIMLATERQELDIDDGKEWPMLACIPLAEMAIVPMSSRDARIAFLARFNELTGAIAS